ncbi:SH3 domain-containing protein [Leptolyngbya sp. NIES-2104]|uniref:SH3 domain-containing protein n=1 Tax=Leptolyngbya sp. NIES-2104 TaxID=1552121 RepID=UPI0006ECC9FA|nr:SH3 domain-containing protein [Leptolyngbya sp. NIES-2104]GAP94580.1 hypothetical protein NIES2104_10910 [Leptolyngbya sp. NIES-2104]
MNTRNWSIALCSAAIAVVATVSPARSETVEITGDAVNVRSGAGLNYGVITVWNRGVQGNRIKQQNGWSYVVTGPVEGWVSSSFVKPVGTSGGAQPTYDAIGRIDNARFKGNGSVEVKMNGDNATVLFAARGENIRPFSTVYYGTVYSNSGSLIRVSLTGFESLRTNGRIPTTGECQLLLNNQQLQSAVCRASGVDHGRTALTKF